MHVKYDYIKLLINEFKTGFNKILKKNNLRECCNIDGVVLNVYSLYLFLPHSIIWSYVSRVNDRIVSVNGVPLENVEYARAVQVLRDSGAAVLLVVRRRAPAPPPTAPTTIKLSLTRNGKKEGK